MHLRTLGLFAVLVSIGIAAACAPNSGPQPDDDWSSTGSTGAAGGAGGGFTISTGSGGEEPIFDGGVKCEDPTDSDGDFIADQLEPGDTDLDGVLDAADDDSDGDGILDSVEAENPALAPAAGSARSATCDPLADTDGDKIPDVRDGDADGDGVPDKDETAYDPDGSKNCWLLLDCDKDGIIDLIEAAAKTDPADAASVPADPGLYFVLPYGKPEQTKDFEFSTGVVKADIYFLIDTTVSMQPAIDDLKASINNQVIPKILNGDLAANPPIPAISDAWIGVGTFRDVPWGPPAKPYGEMVDTGSGPVPDDVYRHRFVLSGTKVAGDTAPPVKVGSAYEAPKNVVDILGSLVAGGGGDAPESTTQALWMAATNSPYAATVGGIWNPNVAWGPYPVTCSAPGSFGVPCFRPESLPLFILVSDAAFHNGPIVQNDYDPTYVQGDKTYAEAVDALKAINAKVIGVPVATGSPGAARKDMEDLAKATGSLYNQPPWGDYPLVPQQDVASGQVSDEVVNLIGKLAGAGLKDVTTKDTNYDCPGGVDCTGDGVADAEFHNPAWPVSPVVPYDASQLITKIATVESEETPFPYKERDETTFYSVRGDAPVTFRVHAKNDTIQPPSMFVMRALIRVQTPAGQILGGKAGIKLVYFVIPKWMPEVAE